MSCGGGLVERIPFTCTFDCGGRCELVACVRDGRLVRIDTPPGRPDSLDRPRLVPCAIGRARRRSLDAPERLLTPLRRTGPRGSGSFREVTWDDALDEVAERLADTRGRYGAEAILHLTGYGSGGGRGLSGAGASSRFFSYWGSVTGTSGNPSTWCASVVARWMLGGNSGAIHPTHLLESRLIILWGMNPVETGSGAPFIAEARDRGARVVLIDPRYTDSGVLADQWLPIRPGTDAALAAAMGHVLEAEGHADAEFLASHTVGYEGYRRYLLGEDDGVPKTPEWAAAITGAPSDAIRRLARDYAAAKPAVLLAGYGPQRSRTGEQVERALLTLACMSGNVGVRGGGLAHAVRRSHRPVSLGGLPRGPFGPARWLKAENWAAAMLEGRLDPPIKLACIVATNAINRSSNTRANARALEPLDFVVVNEPFRTPTALHADVVLPVCTDLERADLVHGGDVWLNRRIVEPRGESRTDYWVFARLAERLGFGAAYTEGKTEEEWLEQLLDASGSVGDGLRRHGVVRADGEPRVPLADFRTDPAAHPLGTPSGRIEILCPEAKDHGLPDLPIYVGGEPAGPEHPLQLVTPHYRFRANSCEHANAWLQRLEPHAVWIHPADAHARGIEHGDPVEVFNRLGTVAIPAKVTERILPGVVCIYQGAWYRPAADGVDEGGCANVLTSHRLSPTGGMAIHSERVDVRKRGA